MHREKNYPPMLTDAQRETMNKNLNNLAQAAKGLFPTMAEAAKKMTAAAKEFGKIKFPPGSTGIYNLQKGINHEKKKNK